VKRITFICMVLLVGVCAAFVPHSVAEDAVMSEPFSVLNSLVTGQNSHLCECLHTCGSKDLSEEGSRKASQRSEHGSAGWRLHRR